MCRARLLRQQRAALWKFPPSLTAAPPPRSPHTDAAAKCHGGTNFTGSHAQAVVQCAVNMWRCVAEHPAVLTHGFIGGREEAFRGALFGKLLPDSSGWLRQRRAAGQVLRGSRRLSSDMRMRLWTRLPLADERHRVLLVYGWCCCGKPFNERAALVVSLGVSPLVSRPALPVWTCYSHCCRWVLLNRISAVVVADED